MSPFTSLRSVARPPEGMTFRTGIWLTHDLDWAGLALHVLPSLAGSLSNDPRQRELEGRSLTGRLTVLRDARVDAHRPACSALRVVAGPPDRTMHAKAAVLVFQSGAKRHHRAYVGSANLTAGGASRNRELLAVEDAAQPGPLTRGLVAVLHDLVNDRSMPPRSAEGLREAIEELRVRPKRHERLLATWPAPAKGNEAIGTSILGQLPESNTSGASRLVIVDPGYARGPQKELVTELAHRFHSVGTVVLVLPWHPAAGDQLTGSEIMLTALRAAFPGAALEVRGMPTEEGNRPRPLHAKAIGWRSPAGETVLVGSANFTEHGLLGRNLELCVLTDQPLKSLVAGTSQVKEPVLRLLPATTEPDPWPNLVATGEYLRRDLHQPQITVRLRIEAEGEWPPATGPHRSAWRVIDDDGEVDLTGRSSPTGEGGGTVVDGVEVRLAEADWRITIGLRSPKGWQERVLPVEVSGYQAPDPESDPDIESPMPPSLRRVLGTLLRGTSKGSKAGSKTGNAPDVLAMPDASIVHLLARGAAQIRAGKSPLTSEELEQAARDALTERRITQDELQVLLAIAGGSVSDDDKKLRRAFGQILEPK